MFSVRQKQILADTVEKALLKLEHPEMPTERLNFKLHVQGASNWSFADIEPNWVYEEEEPSINPWNESQDKEQE